MLKNWGENLLRQAKNFDMEKLPRTIDLYPQYIEEINKLI